MISKHISTALEQKALHSFQEADKIKKQVFLFPACVHWFSPESYRYMDSTPVMQLCIVKQ